MTTFTRRRTPDPSTMATRMANYVEAHVFTGEAEQWKRAPNGLVRLARLDARDPLRQAIGRQAGHDGRYAFFGDDVWTLVIETLAARMATRLGIGGVWVHEPEDCETCAGYGEVTVGHRTHGFAHCDHEIDGYVTCGECVGGHVPCDMCGDEPAVVRLDGHRRWTGHEVCEGCASRPADELVDPEPGAAERQEPAPMLVDTQAPA